MAQDTTRALLEKRERKRQQNRIAQRNYRRNQKERMQALEAALGRSESDDAALTIVSPPASNSAETFLDPTLVATSRSTPPASAIPALACDDSPLWAIDPALIRDNPRPPVSTGLLAAEQGRSSLHFAVCNGDQSMARLLLDRGADVTRQDDTGSTPLHLAAECGLEGLVALLLERSADPAATDFLGRTALFRAVLSENETVVKLLLEASVDVNMKDSLGNVALHLAVESGSESLAVLLLEYGANVNA
ncbi:ankyrin repeat-containing domain protein [Echria macrotheca]|uniref:Ankyrin repeat-containing domain protein n=1 Tax=Echria macrotheca TaxID=438768 RepID=A0AAJ0FBQ6_9PEZI|nr:ankyrin repeat-containing domain protein [Echria macrotheca]